jgi:DNA-binding transcriptional LysR family regulator
MGGYPRRRYASSRTRRSMGVHPKRRFTPSALQASSPSLRIPPAWRVKHGAAKIWRRSPKATNAYQSRPGASAIRVKARRPYLGAWSSRGRFIPQISQGAEQLHTMIALTRAGLGITFVPSWVAQTYSTVLSYVPLSDPLPPYELAGRYDDPILIHPKNLLARAGGSTGRPERRRFRPCNA